jgi:hypothetical protein
MTNKPKNLTVCYDPGTSLSKILYGVGTGSPKYATMRSETIELPSDYSTESLLAYSQLGSPEQNAWIRLSERENIYLIGTIARDKQATISVKKLKYESLIPKVLAALGAIAKKENLHPEFKLNLAILLPLGEYNSGHYLEAEIKKAVESFWFQDRHYTIELKNYKTFPEGWGLVLHDKQQQSPEQFQSKLNIYLMMGYRNLSLLAFEKGTIAHSSSSTTDLGFCKFIDSIIAARLGLNREEILNVITTYREPFYNPVTAKRDYHKISKIDIDRLIKSRDSSRAEFEKKTIEKAIEDASKNYRSLLENWLDESLTGIAPHKIVGCGGTLDFFKNHLEQYFSVKKGINIVEYASNLERELLDALQLDRYSQEEFDRNNLASRFIDVWSIFVYFTNYKKSKPSSSCQETKVA